jgi:hypothetical protein
MNLREKLAEDIAGQAIDKLKPFMYSLVSPERAKSWKNSEAEVARDFVRMKRHSHTPYKFFNFDSV